MSTTETPREAECVNYVQEVLDEMAERLPDCDTGLLELYALLALVSGGGTTLENVHDAWSIYRARTRPDHPALIPFIQLAPDVRELDRKYADAIRAAAADLVLGGVPDPEPEETVQPEPPLPAGIFARVELPGYRQHTETAEETLLPLPSSAFPLPVVDYGLARVELMGHRYREGHLSEVVIAGTPFLRLDLEGGASEFYRPDAVYCITPGLIPPPVPRAEIPARFGYWHADDEDGEIPEGYDDDAERAR